MSSSNLTNALIDITPSQKSDEHEPLELNKTFKSARHGNSASTKTRGNFSLRMRARLVAIVKLAKIAFAPRYLLYTNVTLTFCLSGLGDMLEQQYEIMTGQLNEWDTLRTRHMSLTGIPIGVLSHNCYRMVDYLLPGKSLSVVTKKVLFDQMVCSPIMIATFFIFMAIQERKCFDDFIAELKTKALKLYVMEWVVWPPAQFFNFYVLPPRFRVLYDNLISLGYDVYTSHVKHSVDDQIHKCDVDR